MKSKLIRKSIRHKINNALALAFFQWDGGLEKDDVWRLKTTEIINPLGGSAICTILDLKSNSILEELGVERVENKIPKYKSNI